MLHVREAKKIFVYLFLPKWTAIALLMPCCGIEFKKRNPNSARTSTEARINFLHGSDVEISQSLCEDGNRRQNYAQVRGIVFAIISSLICLHFQFQFVSTLRGRFVLDVIGPRGGSDANAKVAVTLTQRLKVLTFCT